MLVLPLIAPLTVGNNARGPDRGRADAVQLPHTTGAAGLAAAEAPSIPRAAPAACGARTEEELVSVELYRVQGFYRRTPTLPLRKTNNTFVKT